jgi:hypothetical protein
VRALQGRLVYDMLELHKRYGPVVRVAPDELALAYEGVWNEVQGGANDMAKWQPFYRVQHNQTSFIMTAKHEDHSQMRRAMSYGFSNRGIRDMESCMIGMIDKMLDRLLYICSGRIDVVPNQPAREDAKPGGAIIDIV